MVLCDKDYTVILTIRDLTVCAKSVNFISVFPSWTGAVFTCVSREVLISFVFRASYNWVRQHLRLWNNEKQEVFWKRAFSHEAIVAIVVFPSKLFKPLIFFSLPPSTYKSLLHILKLVIEVMLCFLLLHQHVNLHLIDRLKNMPLMPLDSYWLEMNIFHITRNWLMACVTLPRYFLISWKQAT